MCSPNVCSLVLWSDYRVLRSFLDFISHKVFSSFFCMSRLFHKSVNLSFTVTGVKNNLTQLGGI